MSGKEFIKSLLQSFFIVVTLIDVLLFVVGVLFEPETQFGYEIFLYPILYGFCSMIPVAVMYSKKELSMRQLLVRKGIQLVCIILFLLLLIFGFDGVNEGNTGKIAGVSIGIFVTYVLEEVISWFLNNQTAKKLTDELHAYQKNYGEGEKNIL